MLIRNGCSLKCNFSMINKVHACLYYRCTYKVLLAVFVWNSNCVYFCIPIRFIGKNIAAGIGNYNYRCKYCVFPYYLLT